MTPRERAKLRLNRHVPGWDHWEDRQPASRLVERLVERPISWPERLEVRVREEVKITKLRVADVSENAPQLIRLVRFPFALRPVRSKRLEGFDRPTVGRHDREPIPQPAREMGEIRKEYTLASPMSEHDHRPGPRPHPFARARRASDEENTP